MELVRDIVDVSGNIIDSPVAVDHQKLCYVTLEDMVDVLSEESEFKKLEERKNKKKLSPEDNGRAALLIQELVHDNMMLPQI